ncbi:hypothetical protein V8F06_001734 [Rhypophila decipiens]
MDQIVSQVHFLSSILNGRHITGSHCRFQPTVIKATQAENMGTYLPLQMGELPRASMRVSRTLPASRLARILADMSAQHGPISSLPVDERRTSGCSRHGEYPSTLRIMSSVEKAHIMKRALCSNICLALGGLDLWTGYVPWLPQQLSTSHYRHGRNTLHDTRHQPCTICTTCREQVVAREIASQHWFPVWSCVHTPRSALSKSHSPPFDNAGCRDPVHSWSSSSGPFAVLSAKTCWCGQQRET